MESDRERNAQQSFISALCVIILSGFQVQTITEVSRRGIRIVSFYDNEYVDCITNFVTVRRRSHWFNCRICCAAVTVSAADGVRGLMLQGRRKSSNIVVGQFVVENSRDTATFDCDGPDDTVVAWYGTQTGTGSRTFTWLPPDDGAVGQLEFVWVTFSVRFHFSRTLQIAITLPSSAFVVCLSVSL